MTIKCQVPKLECDINFGVPVISVLSFIFSLWTITYFIKTLTECFGYAYDDFEYRDDIFVRPMVHSYLLIAFSTCILLYNGFKSKNNRLIQYWVLLKYVEFILIFVGFLCYLILTNALLCVSFVLFGVGYYLLYIVKSGYIQLGIELDPVTISNLLKILKNEDNNSSLEIKVCDNEDIDKNLSPFAARILRQWGYMILLQIIIIFPGLIIIIINCNILPSIIYSYTSTYDYINIFSLSIGLGILFILCILYICKILPNEASTSNVKEVGDIINNE